MMAVDDRELDPRVIGERLRRQRVRAGLSRVQLSALIGRSPSWLYKVERGDLLLDRLSVLSELARVLDIPVSELLDAPAREVLRGVAPVRIVTDRVEESKSRTKVRSGAPQAVYAAPRHRDTPGRDGCGAPHRRGRRPMSRFVRTRVGQVEGALRQLCRSSATLLAALAAGLAWVIVGGARLASSPAMRRHRPALLTLAAALVSTGLIATITVGLEGSSFARSPYAVVPYTTPPPSVVIPAAPSPSRSLNNPPALAPIPAPAVHVPDTSGARPAAPVAAPAPVVPVTAGPAMPVPALPLGAVTHAVQPVTQTLAAAVQPVTQTVGAVVQPVVSTVGATVHTVAPVSHVVDGTVGALLGHSRAGTRTTAAGLPGLSGLGRDPLTSFLAPLSRALSAFSGVQAGLGARGEQQSQGGAPSSALRGAPTRSLLPAGPLRGLFSSGWLLG